MEAINNPPRVKTGFIHRCIAVVVGGLVLSVCAEWVGMTLYWPEQGAMHSADMLQAEIRYLSNDFQSAANLILLWQESAHRKLFVNTGLQNHLNAFGGAIGLREYVVSAITTLQVFFVRVLVLAFSMPAFALFAVAGLFAGLGLRDLRKFGAGKEYAGVYHRAKFWLPVVASIAWVVYLAMPVAIHPNLIITPCAMLTGINCMIMASTYKKYI